MSTPDPTSSLGFRHQTLSLNLDNGFYSQPYPEQKKLEKGFYSQPSFVSTNKGLKTHPCSGLDPFEYFC